MRFESQVSPIGIRKRNPFAEKVDDLVSSPVVNKLKNVDIFPKVKSNATVKTNLGAIVSILTTLFIIFLIVSEFVMFLRVERKDTLSVDKIKDGKILIFFNITFPNIQCMDLSVDALDASGEQHIDLHHTVHKVPVNTDGVKVSHFESTPVKLGSKPPPTGKYMAEQDPQSPLYCGSCYDADDGRGCCNTCGDVLRKYQQKRLPLPRKEDIEQCIFEVSMENPGCQIYGVLKVNKVSGNFHFAPGRSFSQEQETRVHHIHEFNPYLISRFNSSHTIHELSFGLRIDDAVYPLDNHIESVPDGSALYKYFIKVVPTTVERGNGLFKSTINSYQFSFTRHIQNFDLRSMLMIPGVFFVFELSPIKITYSYVHEPFTHFIVNLCAVIGGVFVVSGYVNKLIEVVLTRMRKKAD
ncbi:endoplasmic reticulum-golgi intermediate compartment protein 3 [Acrasis kona]|uniref:Endoplasmic reticulum-golgi intermediate compartment protein 3 n=1 Tax=Acrasis kona TaxID=1008807 RepID=A0AAW2YYD6_9EUKA